MNLLKTRVIALALVLLAVFAFIAYQNWPKPQPEELDKYVLRITVVDKISGQPVKAVIDVDAQSPEVSTIGGLAIDYDKYSLILEEGFYRIRVEAEPYYQPYEDLIRLDHDLEITIRLERK